jgi:hypothetical protein
MSLGVCEVCRGIGATEIRCGAITTCERCGGRGLVPPSPPLPPLGIVWTDAQWAAEKPWRPADRSAS